MRRIMISLLKDESGATAIEYGLIAAFVGIVLIAALQFLGGALTNIFSAVGNSLNGAAAG